MKIRIIATPTGEAPEYIRQAWIGLELPVSSRFGVKGPYEAYVSGVLTGPRSRFNQLIIYTAILTLCALLFLPHIILWIEREPDKHLVLLMLLIVAVNFPLIFLIFKYIRILTGKVRKAYGYPVNAAKAVEILASHRPDAADWWQENCPSSFRFGGRNFFFNADACQPVDEAEKGDAATY